MRKYDHASLITRKRSTYRYSNKNLKHLSNILYDNWVQNFEIDKKHEIDDSLKNLGWLNNIDISFDNVTRNEFGLLETFNNDQCNGFPKKLQNALQREGLFDEVIRREYKTQLKMKPPLSYTTLICMAMFEMGREKIALYEIYEWIKENFLYYKISDTSWQNSVRHNLSLKKCFEKVARSKEERGKGGFWRINPHFTSNIGADLSKYHRHFLNGSTSNKFSQAMSGPNRNINIRMRYEQNRRSLISRHYYSAYNRKSGGCDLKFRPSNNRIKSTGLLSHFDKPRQNHNNVDQLQKMTLERKQQQQEHVTHHKTIVCSSPFKKNCISEFITIHCTDKVETQIRESSFTKQYVSSEKEHHILTMPTNRDNLDDDDDDDNNLFNYNNNSPHLAQLPLDIIKLLPDL